jgi:putative NADPH-quinone reductase
MKLLVIVAHPNPASFNHALATAAVIAARALGHEVVLHDLYAEQFDPLMPAAEFAKNAALPSAIARHCADLAAADALVIVHPNWWGQPPAILKGWLDRVVRPGVAYEFRVGPDGQGYAAGLLKLRAALVFTTGNTPQDAEDKLYGDPLENLWRNCVFGLIGVKNFRRANLTPVIVSTPEQRARWLDQVRSTVREMFPGEGG